MAYNKYKNNKRNFKVLILEMNTLKEILLNKSRKNFLNFN